VDDDYAATFELDHSTNTSWVYEEFGEDDGLRPGAWSKAHVAGSSTRFYTANRGTDADPWEEIGIRQYLLPTASGRWSVYNPCGITAANFTNGEKYAEVVSVFDARIQSSSDGSSWADEYDIPDPSSASTWESWSRNETLASGSKYVGLFHLMNDYAQSYYVEAADCTLTLNSSNTPTLSIGSEQGNYELDVTITNNTTGDAIEVVFSMGLNEELEIDTAEKTVTYLEDDSSQFQALTLVGGARRDWLKLQPGNNTLEWTQTGTNGVTVTVEWEERYY